jgi:RNA polymerase sigma factor (TIGR02999 family)
LEAHRRGDPEAKDELLSRIYQELKLVARGLLRRELNAQDSCRSTDLVHDAYLRLELGKLFDRAENRRHLFGAVQRAMRQVLVDRARYAAAASRPQRQRRLPLDDVINRVEQMGNCALVDLHELIEALDRDFPRAAEILDMKIFGNLSQREIADLLNLSLSTVEAELRFARASIRKQLGGRR